MKSRLIIVIFIIVCSYILSNTSNAWKGWVFKFDKSGYHLYLPALFIYNDITKLEFYKEIEENHLPSNTDKNYGLNELKNGNRVNKYAVGVAVFEAPFFLASHFINQKFLRYKEDGYTIPYQWGAVISNLFWAVLGLFILRMLLLRYFTDSITALTLLIIAFGTNFFNYTAFSSGMAHPYSFTLFAFLLLHTDNLYKHKQLNSFYYLAATLGLIAITRASNLVVILIPMLWGVSNIGNLTKRFLFFAKQWKQLLISIIVFLAVVMLQLGYWKYVTGHWIYDSYINEGFIWSEPMIIKGLFGFQKGWLVYTPLAILAILGLYSMRKRFKEYIPAIIIFMLLNIYIIFSWWNWWYGGGFGCRPLIESFTILSIPLAAFIEQMSLKHNFKKIAIATICCFFIFLNMFQSYQSYNTTLHWSQMSKAYYFRIFLKTSATTEDREYQMTEREYYTELNRRYEKVRTDNYQ